MFLKLPTIILADNIHKYLPRPHTCSKLDCSLPSKYFYWSGSKNKIFWWWHRSDIWFWQHIVKKPWTFINNINLIGSPSA